MSENTKLRKVLSDSLDVIEMVSTIGQNDFKIKIERTSDSDTFIFNVYDLSDVASIFATAIVNIAKHIDDPNDGYLKFVWDYGNDEVLVDQIKVELSDISELMSTSTSLKSFVNLLFEQGHQTQVDQG